VVVQRASIGRRSASAVEGGVGSPLRWRGRVLTVLFFFPRGGSAQVARALAGALPAAGWQTTLAAGSLGPQGEETNAGSFFSDLDVHPVDYTPALELPDPLAASLPFQPSYEDRPGAPDRVFATVDDAAYERLVAAWGEALVRAAAGEADLLHLHHLTPANEAAIRCFPSLPILGQLHGTELAFLRTVEAGPPAGWHHAARWAERMRGWAQQCELVLVPPGAEAEAALLLGLERRRLLSLPGGVDLARFTRQPLAQTDRFAFWRRWLVDEPRGWDMNGRPGSVTYDEQDLAPFQTGAPVLLYVGRFTAVKRLPLLIAAHARANERLGTPAPLVLVGGHPGEWEGEHPLAAAARLENQHVFLAGWRAHELVPPALNAADLLVLPSVGEAFGLVLVEAMACGLPVVACASHGPAAIVADGKTGWLVPPDGVAALTDAFVAAASDREERCARGERAYAESRRYGWPAIARRLASLYEELVLPTQERASGAGR
jgi:glycosyltransferase involved in cell wall biosynthesis